MPCVTKSYDAQQNYMQITHITQNYRSLSVTPLGTPTAIEALKLLN